MGILKALSPMLEYEAGRTAIEALRKARRKLEEDDE